MAKKKIPRKQLLKQTDEFLTFSARLFQFVIQHKIQILCAFGLVFALILVFSGTRYYSIKSQNKAFALMEQGRIKYENVLNEKGPEIAYSDVQKDFQLIIEKYSSKAGAKLAGVLYANICYRAGDYEKTVGLFKQALDDFADNPSLKDLILSGLGYTLEEKKDYPAAVTHFEEIVSDPGAILKDEALFSLGRIYAKMGDTTKSTDAYKKIVSEFSDSIYLELAKEKVSG